MSKAKGTNAEVFPRSQTVFRSTRFFKEDLARLQQGNASLAAVVLADVRTFQDVWCKSRPGERLPDTFEFKSLATDKGHYEVNQIYVGRGDYRVALMFIKHGNHAYVIGLWKKTKQRNRREVKQSTVRAACLWEELEKRGVQP